MADDETGPFTFQLKEPPLTAGPGRPAAPKIRAALEFAQAHPGQWFVYESVDREVLAEGKNTSMVSNRVASLRKAAERVGMKLSGRTLTDGDQVVGYVRLEIPRPPREDSPTEALDNPQPEA